MTEAVIRDVGSVRVEIVRGLPPACGGAVSMPAEDGSIFMLLEQPQVVGLEECVDLQAVADWGYRLLDLGEPVTALDLAERFDTCLDTARCAFWCVAWEWWQRTVLAEAV